MPEEAPSDFPTIEPSLFDLIVIGTGLTESILAAGASCAGKTVLHLDPNPFYGSHFSSLPHSDFASFITDNSQQNIPESSFPSNSDEFTVVGLKTRPFYSYVDISSTSVLEPFSSRNFCLDLSGPRVLLCADSTVDLMLRSGASHHVEFKSVNASFLYHEGKLLPVPDSREGIFKDRSLSLTEKSQLMRFFKLVREHCGPSSDGNRTTEEGKGVISLEDLESPFIEFLQKQRLPQKIIGMILYAIAMADYDQEDQLACKKPIKTKDGMENLALYHSSVGRFPNAQGAFIYPIYGQGELPQAFCRCAAVKGTLYVLRMPVTSLLLDKENGHYKGVRLASGQDLFSDQLVIDPSFVVPPSGPSHPLGLQHEGSDPIEEQGGPNSVTKVARGICIIRGSIRPDISNLLVVFPPRSLHTDQVVSIRALQLSSNVAVCPPDLSVIYLSTLCDNALQGRENLQAAMNALLNFPISESSKDITSVRNEDGEVENKPILLWSASYVQDLTEGSSDIICSCPTPDGKMDYRDLLESTRNLFHKMYPQAEFFPEALVSENTQEDNGSLD